MKDKERRILADRRLTNNELVEAPFTLSERVQWCMNAIEMGKPHLARDMLERYVLKAVKKLEAEGKV